MKFATIKFEEPESGIGLITLNRPDRLNALSMEMLDDLYALFDHLKGESRVRVLILTGEGRGFCSGADLVEGETVEDLPEYLLNAAHHLEGVQKKYSGIVLEMRRLTQPIIAAVNGPAAGGGMSIALAADVILAAPDATFTPSFINIGLAGSEMGSSYFLPRSVGSARAAEILLTGRTVDAREAERIGMVCRVTGDEDLIGTAIDTARTMLGKSRIGLMFTKEALTRNLETPSLEVAIELENRGQSILCFTPEFAESVMEFSKRKKG